MPELPEVETTTRGLKKTIVGLTIKNVWTDLNTKDKRQKDSVANSRYFILFKKEIIGKTIKSIERRAKNILINLSNNPSTSLRIRKTILIHMKMTGHLLYGEYTFNKKENKWSPKEKTALADPYNRFVHFIIIFSPSTLLRIKNQTHLAFSDARKFGKITLLDTKDIYNSKYLKKIGPEPLSKEFTPLVLEKRLKVRPNGKIKTILMDQTIVAGIGNIYSDEILWRIGVNPERIIKKITKKEINNMLKTMKEILKKGISFGGDSMSDYRNVYGEKGKFQLYHMAYRRTGEKCKKKGCNGIIKRKMINGRSAHFCDTHQK